MTIHSETMNLKESVNLGKYTDFIKHGYRNISFFSAAVLDNVVNYRMTKI